jgi:hypothetical protein
MMATAFQPFGADQPLFRLGLVLCSRFVGQLFILPGHIEKTCLHVAVFNVVRHPPAALCFFAIVLGRSRHE